MKKYKITVNGTSYDVEVEEIRHGLAAAIPHVTPPAHKPVHNTATQKQTPPASTFSAPQGSVSVNAPMPGLILGVKVNVGEQVKKGQVLCILEAMKMENEITAPNDGTVTHFAVSQGDSVSTGQLLVVLG